MEDILNDIDEALELQQQDSDVFLSHTLASTQKDANAVVDLILARLACGTLSLRTLKAHATSMSLEVVWALHCRSVLSLGETMREMSLTTVINLLVCGFSKQALPPEMLVLLATMAVKGTVDADTPTAADCAAQLFALMIRKHSTSMESVLRLVFDVTRGTHVYADLLVWQLPVILTSRECPSNKEELLRVEGSFSAEGSHNCSEMVLEAVGAVEPGVIVETVGRLVRRAQINWPAAIDVLSKAAHIHGNVVDSLSMSICGALVEDAIADQDGFLLASALVLARHASVIPRPSAPGASYAAWFKSAFSSGVITSKKEGLFVFALLTALMPHERRPVFLEAQIKATRRILEKSSAASGRRNPVRLAGEDYITLGRTRLSDLNHSYNSVRPGEGGSSKDEDKIDQYAQECQRDGEIPASLASEMLFGTRIQSVLLAPRDIRGPDAREYLIDLLVSKGKIKKEDYAMYRKQCLECGLDTTSPSAKLELILRNLAVLASSEENEIALDALLQKGAQAARGSVELGADELAGFHNSSAEAILRLLIAPCVTYLLAGSLKVKWSWLLKAVRTLMRGNTALLAVFCGRTWELACCQSSEDGMEDGAALVVAISITALLAIESNVASIVVPPDLSMPTLGEVSTPREAAQAVLITVPLSSAEEIVWFAQLTAFVLEFWCSTEEEAEGAPIDTEPREAVPASCVRRWMWARSRLRHYRETACTGGRGGTPMASRLGARALRVLAHIDSLLTRPLLSQFVRDARPLPFRDWLALESSIQFDRDILTHAEAVVLFRETFRKVILPREFGGDATRALCRSFDTLVAMEAPIHVVRTDRLPFLVQELSGMLHARATEPYALLARAVEAMGDGGGGTREGSVSAEHRRGVMAAREHVRVTVFVLTRYPPHVVLQSGGTSDELGMLLGSLASLLHGWWGDCRFACPAGVGAFLYSLMEVALRQFSNRRELMSAVLKRSPALLVQLLSVHDLFSGCCRACLACAPHTQVQQWVDTCLRSGRWCFGELERTVGGITPLRPLLASCLVERALACQQTDDIVSLVQDPAMPSDFALHFLNSVMCRLSAFIVASGNESSSLQSNAATRLLVLQSSVRCKHWDVYIDYFTGVRVDPGIDGLPCLDAVPFAFFMSAQHEQLSGRGMASALAALVMSQYVRVLRGGEEYAALKANNSLSPAGTNDTLLEFARRIASDAIVTANLSSEERQDLRHLDPDLLELATVAQQPPSKRPKHSRFRA